ncbi:glutathione S-transferase [Aaosphaeria arxii CBS 175.79]|uniref:Glutathione S-transferase n=1 Tax=Aaosphaeria arxii CBS 175.79 TaxID=1450172 RepID=A0A6A5XVT0_9PLEO|nr:glutathione S-transferase [Aaosphaeria arxii CBS 175.79]KAF2017033.1 glutathione S-transferase [Aaosphaeria arxii CBS 175.79]
MIAVEQPPSGAPQSSFGTLYTHHVTPRVYAILAIAGAYGLDLNVIYIDPKKEESQAELLKVNPRGQVPTLVLNDGFVLTECTAIATYITSQSDTTTLLGNNRRDYYQIQKWLSFANSDLLPAIGGMILPIMHLDNPMRKNRVDCWNAFTLDLKVLDAQLQTTPYLAGQTATLADYFTVGMMKFGVMVFHKLIKEQHPRVWEWFNGVYAEQWFKDVAGDLPLLSLELPDFSTEELCGHFVV